MAGGVGGVGCEEQLGLELAVVAPTSSNMITAVRPRSVTMGVPTEVTLVGDVGVDGGICGFSSSSGCDGGRACHHHHGMPVEPGADPAVRFTVEADNPDAELLLCCSVSGGSDCVEQTLAGKLTVVSPTSPELYVVVTPRSVTVWVQSHLTLLAAGPQGASSCAFSSWPCHHDVCHPVSAGFSVAAGARATVEATVLVGPASNLRLCCCAAGGSDCVGQTGMRTRIASVASTSALLFSAVRPLSVTRDVPTDIELVGGSSSGLGDAVVANGVCFFSSWGCTPEGCSEHGVPLANRGRPLSFRVDIAPTSGIRLCCRAHGGSDCVEQESSKTWLTSVAPTSPTIFTGIDQTSVSCGVPTDLSLQRLSRADLTTPVTCGFSSAKVCPPDACRLDDDTDVSGSPRGTSGGVSGAVAEIEPGRDPRTTRFRVLAHGRDRLRLCCRARGGSDCVAQVGAVAEAEGPDASEASSAEPSLRCVAPTSSSMFAAFTPKSVTVGVETTVVLLGQSGSDGDVCGFAANCNTNGNQACEDAVAIGVSAPNPSVAYTIDAQQSVTQAGHGLALCCRAAGGSDCVEQHTQGGLRLKAVEATPGTMFTAINPTSVTQDTVDARFVFIGAATNAGVSCGFAPSCEPGAGSPSCVEGSVETGTGRNPSVVLTIGAPASHSADAASSYVLCCRAVGGGDCVAQRDRRGRPVSLLVVPPTRPNMFTAFAPSSVTMHVPTTVALTGQANAAGDRCAFALDCAANRGKACDNGVVIASLDAHPAITFSVEVSPKLAAPGLLLCCRAAEGTDCVQQRMRDGTTMRMRTRSPTSPRLFKAIAPTKAVEGNRTRFVLSGAAKDPDDACGFATACEPGNGARQCGIQSEAIDTTARNPAVAIVAPMVATEPAHSEGSVDGGDVAMKLCCRAAGGSDCVEQASENTRLTVAPAPRCNGTSITVANAMRSGGTAPQTPSGGVGSDAADGSTAVFTCTLLHERITWKTKWETKGTIPDAGTMASNSGHHRSRLLGGHWFGAAWRSVQLGLRRLRGKHDVANRTDKGEEGPPSAPAAPPLNNSRVQPLSRRLIATMRRRMMPMGGGKASTGEEAGQEKTVVVHATATFRCRHGQFQGPAFSEGVHACPGSLIARAALACPLHSTTVGSCLCLCVHLLFARAHKCASPPSPAPPPHPHPPRACRLRRVVRRAFSRQGLSQHSSNRRRGGQFELRHLYHPSHGTWPSGVPPCRPSCLLPDRTYHPHRHPTGTLPPNPRAWGTRAATLARHPRLQAYCLRKRLLSDAGAKAPSGADDGYSYSGDEAGDEGAGVTRQNPVALAMYGLRRKMRERSGPAPPDAEDNSGRKHEAEGGLDSITIANPVALAVYSGAGDKDEKDKQNQEKGNEAEVEKGARAPGLGLFGQQVHAPKAKMGGGGLVGQRTGARFGNKESGRGKSGGPSGGRGVFGQQVAESEKAEAEKAEAEKPLKKQKRNFLTASYAAFAFGGPKSWRSAAGADDAVAGSGDGEGEPKIAAPGFTPRPVPGTKGKPNIAPPTDMEWETDAQTDTEGHAPRWAQRPVGGVFDGDLIGEIVGPTVPVVGTHRPIGGDFLSEVVGGPQWTPRGGKAEDGHRAEFSDSLAHSDNENSDGGSGSDSEADSTKEIADQPCPQPSAA